MNPDWYHDRDLTTEEADYLAGLDEIRANQPLVWALVCGLQTVPTIAKTICWPQDWVLLKLRELKKDDIVFDSEGKRSVLWQFMPHECEYLEYKAWVLRQKLKGGLFDSRRNEG